MQESGGRRIKRPIRLKISSIRYLNNDEIDELKKIQLLKPYIEERQEEIEHFNKEKGFDRSMQVKGRHLTNSGLFRQYIDRKSVVKGTCVSVRVDLGCCRLIKNKT